MRWWMPASGMGMKFNLGTQRRYTPGYLKMREIVESGEIGERRSVIAYSGGAALWGYTHAADMLLFLASDSEVKYVQGNVAVDDADFDDNRTDGDPPIVMGYVRFKMAFTGSASREVLTSLKSIAATA